MPLSEQEQRMLDEMERHLYHNDADFVAAVSGRGRLNYASLVLGVLLAIAGLGVIIVGVVIHQLLIGLLGFVIMFGGVLLALHRSKGFARQTRAAAQASKGQDSRANRGSFMDRMNDRWDNREERD